MAQVGDEQRTAMTYNMDGFLRSCVLLYQSLLPDVRNIKPTLTPCVVEDRRDAPAARLREDSGGLSPRAKPKMLEV